MVTFRESEIANSYGFVYITTNLINGKKYIGQRKVTQGWKFYLGSGTRLKLAIKKYGKENFHRDIIATAHSREELDDLEIEWINNSGASTNRKYYNITIGGSGVIGEIERKTTKVVCLNTGVIYDSMSKASKQQTNSDCSSITQCCTNKLLSGGKDSNGAKLVWAYYTDYVKMSSLEIINKIHWANNSLKGENCYKAKKVVCLNNRKIFDTIQEASKYYGCGYPHISSCCVGTREHCGKDKLTNKRLAWAYYDDFVKNVR